MLKDQKELRSVLNDHGVEYLIVGGQAVIAYGVPRLTKDLDVFVRSDTPNSELLFRALAKFGAPLHGFSPEDFRHHPEAVFQFGVEPNRIDVLQSIGSLDFEQAWQRRVEKEVEKDLLVPFLAVEDLIQNKLETGRLQDLADADQLKKMGRVR